VRIVIDLQAVQCTSRFRGIGRYSLALAEAMARNAGKHEIWLVLNAAFQESIPVILQTFGQIVPADRIRIFEIPLPVAECEKRNAWRVRAAELIRENFLSQLKPDIVHVASLFEGYRDDATTSVGAFATNLSTAVTLYDLIPYINQKEYLADPAQRAAYLRKVSSLQRAGLLLSISEASRREAIDGLQIQPQQVVTISAAADGIFSPLNLSNERIGQLYSRLGIQRKVIMYAPGGFDWRKNFEGLISAYAQISETLRAEHQLVIVGDIDEVKEKHLLQLAKNSSLAKEELVLTGYVSDSDLVELYNVATVFVFPSKQEGFGLPVLEAMACGAATIGSNISSIPEVIGLPEALFDPFSPQAIADKITQVLCDESFRLKLKSHGLGQAKRFSWDESAKRAIQAMESFVSSGRHHDDSIPANDSTVELERAISEISEAVNPTDSDIVRVAECITNNSPRAGNKQLLLDISVIVHGDAKSGIQRVVRSLLSELLQFPPADTDVHPIYFDEGQYKYASEFTAVFVGMQPDGRADEIVEFHQHDTYLALDLNAHLTAAVHDFHMRLQHRGVNLFFIVYDLLLVQHPEWWPKGTGEIFEAWLRSIAQVASGLICISEAVADEVREWLENNPTGRVSGPIVSSFHLGADVESSLPSQGMPANAEATLNAIQASPSFLMVGTVEPRKGHAQTLSAFERLWDQDIDVNLIIVGKKGWLVDELAERLKQHAELGKRLFWLEGISDEYLERVYSGSTCLIAASKGEGFGLPLIEAAQHKKPIIARDLPVFREVAGDHAYYFSGLSPISMAITITKWLILHQKGEHPKSEDMPYLSWHESALQLKAQLHSIQARELAQINFNGNVTARHGHGQPRNIYVDISSIVQKDLRTGIQRVTRSILNAAMKMPPGGYQIQPVYANTSGLGYYLARSYIQQVEGLDAANEADSPIDPQPGDVFLGLDFVAGIINFQKQYLKWLRNTGINVYFIVYDLLPISLPNAFPAGVDNGHREWLKDIAAFDGAICISQSVKDDLDNWIAAEPAKRRRSFSTGWFHLGADLENSIPSKGLPENAGDVLNILTSCPTFLMVGTIEPRKGYQQTIAAFEKLWANGIQVNLVIVGKEGWMSSETIHWLRQHPEQGRRLFWLEGVSDEFLERIYAASQCLIASSENEGFGLPLIEAARHRLPIIARDIPVFREVAGEHAFYFKGLAPEELADAITIWLGLKEKNMQPKSEGIKILTWQQSALQLQNQLLEFLKSK